MPAQDNAIASQRRFSSRLKLRAEIVKPDKEQSDQPDGVQEPQERVEQWDVLAGLRNYAVEHVVLSGKPGSGKSTSLERLLWEEAEKALQDPNARIPVLVKLRRCTGTIEGLIRDFLVGHQVALEITQIEELLRQGKFLLLLDGLNELPKAFETEVTNFRDRYRRTTPMIVSTRDFGRGGTLGIQKTLKMLPLTETQMREFVRGYLGEESDRLFQQIQGDRLRKFAETPLLLWMLCRVFAQSGQVPTNLGLAFREFAQLHDQELQADAQADSKDQWHKLLRHLAFALMQGETLTDLRLSMPKEEAEDCLTAYLQQAGRSNSRECAELWLKDLLKYHLIQPVIQPNFEEHIEFRHQLIQEYYAAEYLLKLLPNLTDDQLKRDYLNYLKWTEPVALMLALEDKEAQALRVVKLALNEVDWTLGSRLAGEVKPAFQAQTVKFVEELDVPSWLKVQLLGETRSDYAIPTWVNLAEGCSWETRKEIAELLSHIRSNAAIAALLKLLEDSYFSVRMSAAKALGEIGSDEAIPGLLKLLEKADFSIRANRYARQRAVDSLGEIGSELAVSSLLELIDDPDSRVRCSVVNALGKIGTENSTSALLKLLEDSDPDVSQGAAKALCAIGSDAGISACLNSLGHRNDLFCIEASILGKIGSDTVISGLHKLTDDANSRVRGDVAEALGETGSEKAIPSLLKLMDDSDSGVRARVAGALGEIGSNVVIVALLQLLEDTNPNVRKSAAKGIRKALLTNIKSEATIATLIKLAKHHDFNMRWRVAEALDKIGSNTAIPILLKLVQDSDVKDTYHTVRKMAAKALGKIGSNTAIPSLLKMLEDANSGVRESAAEALGEIGSDTAIPGLLKLVGDSKSKVRAAAAEALGEIGSDTAISGLLKLVEDSDIDVHWKASVALGKIGSDKAIPGLFMLLEHDSSDVRESVAEALGEIGSEAAIPGLCKLLGDSTAKVFWVAAKELGRIGSDTIIPDLSAGLLELMEDENSSVRKKAAETLSEFAKKHTEVVARHLPHLHMLSPTQFGEDAYSLVQAIQANCKFHNYEIFQAHLAAQKADHQTQPNRDPGTTIHIAGDYIAGDKIQGDKIAGNKTEHQFPNAAAVKIFENVENYHESPPKDSSPPFG
jgi:HEAT repeat protein